MTSIFEERERAAQWPGVPVELLALVLSIANNE